MTSIDQVRSVDFSSSYMAMAFLAGRKTQFRRPIEPQPRDLRPGIRVGEYQDFYVDSSGFFREGLTYKPEYEVGETLLVKGTNACLRIVAVRAERLRRITNGDCLQEGYSPVDSVPFYAFQMSWTSKYAFQGYFWETNPWVWVYIFIRVATGCEYCREPRGRDYTILPCANGEQGLAVACLRYPLDSAPGLCCYRYGMALGHFRIKYCPMCGRELGGEADE